MAVYIPEIYHLIGRVCQFIAIWFFIKPFYCIFYRIKVTGRENLPKDKKLCIVMPNHLSNNDPPLLSAILNIPIAWMAKEELFVNLPLRFLITVLGAFSVDRQKLEKTTIKATKEIVEKNWNLGLFLEGTRSKTPDVLGEPNIGPAYIARLNDLGILPVGIVGSNRLFGQVTVKIGKLFYPDKDLEKAKWQCAEKLAELTGFKLPTL